MTKKPVEKTAKERLESKYEDMVTGVKIWDCGPDDAVFTTASAVYIPPISTRTPKKRYPLEMLRSYSEAWAEHGMAAPDLVFQTRSDGERFADACLRSLGVPHTSVHEPAHTDGFCVTKVMGVHLIWPEK